MAAADALCERLNDRQGDSGIATFFTFNSMRPGAISSSRQRTLQVATLFYRQCFHWQPMNIIHQCFIWHVYHPTPDTEHPLSPI